MINGFAMTPPDCPPRDVPENPMAWLISRDKTTPSCRHVMCAALGSHAPRVNFSALSALGQPSAKLARDQYRTMSPPSLAYFNASQAIKIRSGVAGALKATRFLWSALALTASRMAK
jgi:hypothetical protein